MEAWRLTVADSAGYQLMLTCDERGGGLPIARDGNRWPGILNNDAFHQVSHIAALDAGLEFAVVVLVQKQVSLTAGTFLQPDHSAPFYVVVNQASWLFAGMLAGMSAGGGPSDILAKRLCKSGLPRLSWSV